MDWRTILKGPPAIIMAKDGALERVASNSVWPGKGQPALLASDTLLDIQLFDGSGHLVQSGTCTISAQQTDESCRVNGSAARVYKFQVSARNQKLLKGTGLVLVRLAPADK